MHAFRYQATGSRDAAEKYNRKKKGKEKINKNFCVDMRVLLLLLFVCVCVCV